jgi:hypothetical protein
VVARLLVLLIALALVASPDRTRTESVGDRTAEHCLADVVLFAHGTVPTAEPRAATTALPTRSDSVPPSPSLAGVFRPPREELGESLLLA